MAQTRPRCLTLNTMNYDTWKTQVPGEFPKHYETLPVTSRQLETSRTLEGISGTSTNPFSGASYVFNAKVRKQGNGHSS